MSEPWTTDDIPDQSGRVAIVTGANSGIGYEAAVELARKGATVILACRSEERGKTALTELLERVPGARAEVMMLDLADLDSVRVFADAFRTRFDRLDLLINNAGIMAIPYDTTVDGFEQQMGTNHLGHFALTGLLIDLLVATPGSRVVTVSSNAHRGGTIDFDNLLYEGGEGYSRFDAYSRSKLANLLFTDELQRRLDAVGAGTIAVAAHPGGSATNLASHFEERWYVRLVAPLLYRLMQSAADGALPTLRAAVDPEAEGGAYYGPDGFMELRGDPVRVEPSESARDRAAARRLWERSEALTAVTYEVLAPQ